MRCLEGCTLFAMTLDKSAVCVDATYDEATLDERASSELTCDASGNLGGLFSGAGRRVQVKRLIFHGIIFSFSIY